MARARRIALLATLGALALVPLAVGPAPPHAPGQVTLQDAGISGDFANFTDITSWGPLWVNDHLRVNGSLRNTGGLYAEGGLRVNHSSGVTLGSDTNLYRRGASQLGTDSEVVVTRPTTETAALNIKGEGEPGVRMYVTPTGMLRWADGTSGWDTNLYRTAPSRLQTDSTLAAPKYDFITTALGNCDATTRGTLQLVEGSTGASDVLYMCMKSSSNAYSWRTVATG